MRLALRSSAFIIACSLCVLTAPPASTESQGEGAKADPQLVAREEAYRANNLGVALLEQFKHREAAEEFRRALKVSPSLSVARLNLAIALYNVPDLEGALREAKLAADAMPDSPRPHYLLGLVARKQNRTEDALAEFERVLKADARDVGANVNLGQLYLQQRKYKEASGAFRAAIAAEPYNITAIYNLAITLIRMGNRDEGQQVMQQFQKLREGKYATALGEDYLEQGQYAEAVASTGAEAELVDAATPEVTFKDATGALLPAARTGEKPVESQPVFGRAIERASMDDAAKRNLATSLGGGAVLFDYDGDADLDLLEVAPSSERLYRNDGGKFTDVTGASGLTRASQAIGVGAVAGDYDNDGRADLFVLRYGGSALYHNDGGGKFSDVTAAAEVPNYPFLSLSAAFVDVDHDGDLDIFVAGFADLNKPAQPASGGAATFPDDFSAAPSLLLRNNGNGKFTDITAAAKVQVPTSRAVAVVPTDYDNRRDIDLLLVNYGGAPALLRNQRDGTFLDVAADAGLTEKGRFACAAAGDANKDGFTDFFLGKSDGAGVFVMSDGKGRFTTAASPLQEPASAAQLLDYDNDGLLDLVAFTGRGLNVVRNLGNKWENATGRAAPGGLLGEGAQPPSLRALASGDVDGDGDEDVLARLATGEIKIARNEGASNNRSLRVSLVAKVSNRSSAGTKIEMRAGSLHQKLETYSASPAPAPADVLFGLGKRERVDAVRVLWPVGILQAETEITVKPAALAAALTVTELDRKPSSCPYLYTWNGERFEFVTDFMGGGEMGYSFAPGVYNHPDPDEYVRVRDDQLRELNGRYEIRVTNELEEVLYVDRLQLVAIAHPADTEVYPNEGMTHAPRGFKLFATRGPRPPVSATDGSGHDVTDRIARLDRRFVDDFDLLPIRGYAKEHALTLDLGGPASGRTLLLLTGWTDYAFSSDNVAAGQSGLQMKPPALQVKDAEGRWQTVVDDVGIPVGRPQTIVLDLTNKFLSRSREVRILTNMRIYWDRILVDTSSAVGPKGVVRLEAATAQLRWRGFSAEVTPDGREPFGYDYSRVSLSSPWKVIPGRYTREGDVRGLLSRSDDMFVISRPGDEIAVTFDATRLPPLPAGWKRTFLVYADGFSKEMDINSASPDAVLPLPFHGMKSYPYAAPESYPMTRARRDYISRYNTRIVKSSLPPIETAFDNGRSRH